VELFDSLTHVTTDGSWFTTPHDASAARLLRELQDVAPYRGCVVGIAGTNMPNEHVLDVCRRAPRQLVPVAGVDASQSSSTEAARNMVTTLGALGFRGVKVHPRANNVDLFSESFGSVLRACDEVRMPLFLCTNVYGIDPTSCRKALASIGRVLTSAPTAPVLLLHGGFTEIAAATALLDSAPGAMLDFSFTLLRYESPEFDKILTDLVERYPDRCVVGSDFPEHSLAGFRVRVERLSAGLADELKGKLCSVNLSQFLGV
jgi:predicted TIM-barrel fold metal-dependent hydrolase